MLGGGQMHVWAAALTARQHATLLTPTLITRRTALPSRRRVCAAQGELGNQRRVIWRLDLHHS
jgi:hypothetical protein